MKLFHVSENSDISEFVPLPPPNKEAGVVGNAVWAINESELPNYLLPRECPRVCYRNEKGKKVIAIEEGWIEKIKQTALYLYEFPTESFFEIDAIAGYWISRETVVPNSVTKIEKIFEELDSYYVLLKILPHLHDEKDYVLENFEHFSIIRFRNACSR